MTIPDLYLIGAPKCGTTSLARWLGGHPDVYLSVPKEPFYWASDYPRLRTHYGFHSRVAYESLYASPESQQASVRVDGSTVYLYSQTAVPDIVSAAADPRFVSAAADPRFVSAAADPRFVVALRNPVDLLVSYHRTQLVALNEDEADFATAWRRSIEGGLPPTDPLDPKLVDYPLVGRLGQAMQRLLAVVPRERVHVVLFEELAGDPGGTWERLCGFLGISAAPAPSFDIHNASTKTYRSASLRRLTHRPPAVLEAPMARLRQWSRTTPHPAVARVKARMWRAQARPELSGSARAEVGDYLRADTVQLAQLLDRDLSHWTGKRGEQAR